MENLLCSMELWAIVEREIPVDNPQHTPAQKKALEELRLKDMKAMNYLFSAIDKSILKTITKKDTTKLLWDSMKLRYQGNEKVKRAQLNRLRRSFELLMMKNGESVMDYFGRVMLVANEMRSYGEIMEDVKIVEKILRTLTEKWIFVVCSIEESNNTYEMSLDTLQSSLLVHEQKFKRSSEEDEEQALKVSNEARQGTQGSNEGQQGMRS